MDIKFYESGYKHAVRLSDDSPCDEGVVIRIEGGLCPALYKAKSPMFLAKETKDLDNNIVSMEDEDNV